MDMEALAQEIMADNAGPPPPPLDMQEPAIVEDMANEYEQGVDAAPAYTEADLEDAYAANPSPEVWEEAPAVPIGN